MRVITLIATFVVALFFLVMLISEVNESFSVLNVLGAIGLYTLYRIDAVREAVNWFSDKLKLEEDMK